MGILYFAAIVGLVVDQRHTLILGWTDRTVLVIKEICKANASEGGGIIAVLADMDKEVLEQELEGAITESELQGTKVVFRSGSRLIRRDLRKMSVDTARSVIVLTDTNLPPDKSDANILQVVLNLQVWDHSLWDGSRPHTGRPTDLSADTDHWLLILPPIRPLA